MIAIGWFTGGFSGAKRNPVGFQPCFFCVLSRRNVFSAGRGLRVFAAMEP